MSKRSIAYIKPEEPSFLRKIKEQVGYKEGPTVDTKREEQRAVLPEDLEDTGEEQPTVVVLTPGDLTAEEAEAHRVQKEKEEEEKPADLDAPIVFKARKRKTATEETTTEKQPKKDKKRKNPTLLSFDDEEEEEF